MGSEDTVKLDDLNNLAGIRPGQGSIQSSSMISSSGVNQFHFKGGSAAAPTGGVTRQTVICDFIQQSPVIGQSLNSQRGTNNKLI